MSYIILKFNLNYNAIIMTIMTITAAAATTITTMVLQLMPTIVSQHSKNTTFWRLALTY